MLCSDVLGANISDSEANFNLSGSPVYKKTRQQYPKLMGQLGRTIAPRVAVRIAQPVESGGVGLPKEIVTTAPALVSLIGATLNKATFADQSTATSRHKYTPSDPHPGNTLHRFQSETLLSEPHIKRVASKSKLAESSDDYDDAVFTTPSSSPKRSAPKPTEQKPERRTHSLEDVLVGTIVVEPEVLFELSGQGMPAVPPPPTAADVTAVRDDAVMTYTLLRVFHGGTVCDAVQEIVRNNEELLLENARLRAVIRSNI